MAAADTHVRFYAEEIARNLESIVDLTAELVATESPTDHIAGVTAVTTRLARSLESQGAETKLVDLDGYGPILEARLRLGAGKRVLILGHSDTVWPVGTAASWPFQSDRDGMLTGPGVGDMKVCLATATFALGALARGKPTGIGEVTLLVVSDEEAGSIASRPAIERAARAADACLTIEAARPGGGIVTSREAVGAMRVRATGRAQHVTDPRPHASALAPLVRLVGLIEGEAGATVGLIRAGTARQIVPGDGELLVDLRAPTTEAAEALAERIASYVRSIRTDGVSVDLTGGVTRPAWSRTPETAVLFRAARGAAEALGVAVFEVAERGGSDASFAGALGVPTLDGLGPLCNGSCSRDEVVSTTGIPTWGAILCAVVASVSDPPAEGVESNR